MDEEPNERSTLLAKNQRGRHTDAAGNAVDDADQDKDDTAHDNDGTAAQTAHIADAHAERVEEEEELSVSSSSDLYEMEFACVRLKYYLIEPLVLVLLFAYNLSSTIVKNQIIYQTCVAVFAYNTSDCKLLGTADASNRTKVIETAVQPYAAHIFMYSSLVESIVPALGGVFVGAWSDRFGRKPLLVTAFCGYAFYYAIAAIIAQLATVKPVSPWYFLLAVLPQSLLGGNVTLSVAAFCFISDVSSAQERPYRLVFYEAAVYVGLMTGALAAGYLYEASNSTTVFLTSASVLVLAIFIIVCFIPESLNLRRNAVAYDDSDAESAILSTAERQPLQRLFDLELLKEMFWTCFKPRQFNDRGILWLAIVALLTSMFVIDGSMNVFYLFTREKFHWTIKEYTMYETISILVSTMGNILGMWALHKICKMPIVHLGIVAFLSEAASCFMKGFAFNSWQLYVAVAMGALKSMGHPMCRTIITNIVPANELGKIFSLNSVLQSFLPFIASPVYTGMYALTLSSFPGFFNVLSANLNLVAVAFLLVILRKRQIFPEHYGLLLN